MTKELTTTLRSVLEMVFLVLFGLFFMFGEVLGATTFDDNFDTYNLGDLTGQGNWICEGGAYHSMKVVNTQYISPTQSAGNDNYYYNARCWKKGDTHKVDGQAIVHFKITSSGSGGKLDMGLGDDTYNTLLRGTVWTNLGDFYITTAGGEVKIFENVSLNTWHAVIFDWVSSTDLYRIKLDNVWSNWYSDVGTSYISSVKIASYSAEISYFDDIQMVMICGEVGGCANCDFYGCLANSDKCCWIIDQCIEGVCYIGGGTCGSGSNLFFCETQVSCEGFGGYWWQGTCSSYTQPYLPPQDVCEGLGTIEKWLCEIKNLLKGVFVPSQEKTEELRQTVDAIKQKFPMNYLAGASNFFSVVKTNVNSTSNIDFKILGKAGTVNFAFWEKETEIGGAVQKIGEIFKVFITFLVVLGFVFWAISFGKRVF